MTAQCSMDYQDSTISRNSCIYSPPPVRYPNLYINDNNKNIFHKLSNVNQDQSCLTNSNRFAQCASEDDDDDSSYSNNEKQCLQNERSPIIQSDNWNYTPIDHPVSVFDNQINRDDQIEPGQNSCAISTTTFNKPSIQKFCMNKQELPKIQGLFNTD